MKSGHPAWKLTVPSDSQNDKAESPYDILHLSSSIVPCYSFARETQPSWVTSTPAYKSPLLSIL